MVKSKKENTTKHSLKQGDFGTSGNPAIINASTDYELCDTRMTAYGGLLALEKVMDLVNFKELFERYYYSPGRKPELGCYRMVYGLIMLLFIGFSRIGHFYYIRHDPMVCGILHIKVLPAISTFWRYLSSLLLNQSQSILNLGAAIRRRVWQLCSLGYESICIDVDTMVSTVYGAIEGSRKGHNTKHRGKKGLRPVFLFIEETREYLCGTQRSGTTMTDKEMARLIRDIRKYLPECVKHVLIKGDAEFIGRETVHACEECGFKYIFANKRCAASFDESTWHTWNGYDYNETMYEPNDWGKRYRFVVMRIREDQKGDRQLDMFDGENKYMHRVFVTNESGKSYTVIRMYDKRASVEGMIKEAQQEGILAIPSKRFLSNHCFFQIVMLTYNIWRWMKLLAGHQQIASKPRQEEVREGEMGDAIKEASIVNHTIRIARLKMLFIAAKIVTHERKTTVKYSEHDERAAGIIDFMEYLDRKRNELRPWDCAA